MTGSCNAHTLEQVKHPTYRLSRVWKGVTRKEWMEGGRAVVIGVGRGAKVPHQAPLTSYRRFGGPA